MIIQNSLLASTALLVTLTSPLLAQEESTPTDPAVPQEPVQEPAAQETSEAFQHLDPEAAITVNFQDEDLGEILELFSTNYELNLVYGPDVVGVVTMNFFNAPVQDALQQLLSANGFTFETDGKFILVQPRPAASPGAAASKFLPTVIYLNHIQAGQASALLQPLLSGPEKLVTGFGSQKGIDNMQDLGGNEEASREMMVLYASEQTVAKVYELLGEIDRPPTQVLVEATIMSVSLSNDFQLGVDFSAYGGIDFQALGGSSNITDGVSPDSFDTSGIGGWLGGISQRGFTDGASNGLHFGILRNQVGVFVSALENVTNATVLSNPQILTVNRHAAQLLVGRKLPYITTTVTQTGTLQSVEFLEVGTSLVFRPFVTDDGYVRLEVYPKKSDGFINALGLPEETTTEVKTNILVKEGNTVVIGGLMESSMVTQEEQVPFLGDIPFLGNLFKSQNEVESKNEIIVMLTPHVVDDATMARRSAEQKNRLGASMANLAASHNGYLRPGYARRMYAEAATALASGDPQSALAKAEWGLSAMPADPDLAALADHCRREIDANFQETSELNDALELLEDLRNEEAQQ